MLPEATMSERKYGQRGYMEDEPREKRPRSPGPRERSEKPRGRGLGAPTRSVFKCSRCGANLATVKVVAFDATCPDCGELKLRHRVCEACGVYRGTQVTEGNADT